MIEDQCALPFGDGVDLFLTRRQRLMNADVLRRAARVDNRAGEREGQRDEVQQTELEQPGRCARVNEPQEDQCHTEIGGRDHRIARPTQTDQVEQLYLEMYQQWQTMQMVHLVYT